MNIHEIFDKYKNKRETIWAVYMDLFEQCNEIRKQRDFAMTMIKFIDMKNAIDTPNGTFEEVIRLMDLKDEENQQACNMLMNNQSLKDLEWELGLRDENK